MINGLLHLPIRAAELRMAVFQQIAALDAAGFVIAPKEPDERMAVSGGLAIEKSMFEDQDPLVFDGAKKCYRAMIEFRPQSPSGGER